ncbi:MAG TPA: metalloregulator ArsR/SmtB family transcription factor [Thermoanaerobaculia bacterium]|nr:metalloregulator ArsR/SmtB family transcription factor [Thermoanaerobaculia bacterium]
MATKQKDHAPLSPEALELVAERFRVLAEPLRLQILQLVRNGEKNVTELTELLGTTQPNVSKHLRVLQEAGLIGRRQAGNTVYCFVSDPSVFELCDVVCTALHARMAAQTRLLARARK